ncbi:DUF805 domain-containing protein [Bacillus sp. CLL-7-23]|uniref:DUF805 domain-containing protein n=1 Tax=Bacillus changyiensis TaxID=3004103 RepID=A0ABT4X779_9BACI|nr:DUF805 domain-containing protein [Bacillus changyiensis]MDA7028151.1 DUF805 domain-containing protein [Bacillus changyiensis]
MKWYLEALKNYAKFEGRARRKEYWMFHLFNTIILLALFIIGRQTAIAAGIAAAGGSGEFGVKSKVAFLMGYIPLFIYIVATFVPALAITVRRFHDIGKSGKWVWLNLIPLIGTIILVLIFFCKDSEAKDNQYGPNPKVF